jgi:hypothetical protein
MDQMRHIAFVRIARAALRCSDSIVQRWLPHGKRVGAEWVSRNPTRDDRRSGSFKVNLSTGAWADFATGDAGADLVSLAASLSQLKPGEAALRVAHMLGADPYDK